MSGKARILLLAWLLGGCTLTPEEQSARNARATVLLEHSEGHLTGFIVGPDRILTHKTVLKGKDLKATFFDGETYPGRVAWQDDVRGLVLIEAFTPRVYPVASPACIRPSSGDRVTLVGHPNSIRWETLDSVLPGQGLYADQYRSLGVILGEDVFGAPVFNEKGHAIGMVQAILANKKPSSAGSGRAAYEEQGIGLMRHARDFCVGVKVAALPKQ